ncbi:tetratricopeptide repeat protein [Advenella sp. S44]|uniref:tetratricopeptide repeat protein n=1 Tax=Advenella sp. S44 TaxID=1982755 RepID=UPI0013747D32|nr:tetratricopeptide repeat protein [Advenella sp. S44]
MKSVIRAASLVAPLLWTALAHAQFDQPVDRRAVLDFLSNEQAKPVVLVNHTEADDIYRLLIMEIAAQEGKTDMAAETAMALARDRNMPRMAKRAMHLYLATSQSQAAAEAARLWSKLAPGDEEAIAATLALSASNGDTAGIVKALRKRIAEAGNKDRALYQAAAVVARMKDKQEALDVFTEVIDNNGDTLSVAHLLLADLAAQAGNPVVAWEAARKSLALGPDSDAAAERVLQYGVTINHDLAMSLGRKFIEAHPNIRRVRLLYISQLVDDRQFESALADLKRMRKTFPEDFDLLYLEAQVNYQAKRYKTARARLNEFLEVQGQRRQALPDAETNAQGQSTDARLLFAQIDEDEGKYRDAIAQLDKIDEVAALPQIRMKQAALYGKLGQLNKALALLAEIRTETRDDKVIVELATAQVLAAAGRTDRAITHLVQADKALPDSPAIKYDLAMLYERQGKIVEMETLLRRVIAIKPDSPDAYNALGYVFADLNINLDQAQMLLDKAVQLAPDNPFILDSMGWLQFRLGNDALAGQYLENAFELSPQADIAAHLAEVYWSTGDKKRARAMLKQGWQLDKENQTLKETLKRLGVRLK